MKYEPEPEKCPVCKGTGHEAVDGSFYARGEDGEGFGCSYKIVMYRCKKCGNLWSNSIHDSR